MPVYTCTTNTETLTTTTRDQLAEEITRIHAERNHVPTAYVNVVFHEVTPDKLYADARPAGSLLINGWVREGHPADETSQLALDVAAAAARVTGLPERSVLVVIQSSPAYGAVEGGQVLPEPGAEAAWFAQREPH